MEGRKAVRNDSSNRGNTSSTYKGSQLIVQSLDGCLEGISF